MKFTEMAEALHDVANVIAKFDGLETQDYKTLHWWITPKDKEQTLNIFRHLKARGFKGEAVGVHYKLQKKYDLFETSFYVSMSHLEKVEKKIEQPTYTYPELEALENQEVSPDSDINFPVKLDLEA